MFVLRLNVRILPHTVIHINSLNLSITIFSIISVTFLISECDRSSWIVSVSTNVLIALTSVLKATFTFYSATFPAIVTTNKFSKMTFAFVSCVCLRETCCRLDGRRFVVWRLGGFLLFIFWFEQSEKISIGHVVSLKDNSDERHCSWKWSKQNTSFVVLLAGSLIRERSNDNSSSCVRCCRIFPPANWRVCNLARRLSFD